MRQPLLAIPFLLITVFLLIRAQIRSERRQVYLFQPLSTLLVILAAALSFGRPGAPTGYTVGILSGLLLSLGGDIALMFAPEKAFLSGLVLCLLAHVAYAVTFTMFTGFHRQDLVSGGVLLALSAAGYLYLQPGLREMKGPVMGYILVIGFMVNRAVSAFFSPTFSWTQAWLLTIAAVLFWSSDLVLAVNRFRRPIKYHSIGLTLYYAGQLLIALSPAFFA